MKSLTRPYNQRVRAESAEATASRIVDAFLARLMRQWYDEITLDRVAQDAGVTVQTVVRRFGGKEGLLAHAVRKLATQIVARRGDPSRDNGSLLDNLIADYEHTGDTVIRLLALEPRHPALKEFLDFGRTEHRTWTSSAFADVLGALDTPARKAALDALVITTDVYAWKLLRRDMGRSVPAAATAMKLLVDSTISQLTKSSKPTKNT